MLIAVFKPAYEFGEGIKQEYDLEIADFGSGAIDRKMVQRYFKVGTKRCIS
jgi:hypothetical protein